MKLEYVTLGPVQRGRWTIKASILDCTILVFFYNKVTTKSMMAVFYNEDTAYAFIKQFGEISPIPN